MNLKVCSSCFYQSNNCKFALLTLYKDIMAPDQFQAPDYFLLDELLTEEHKLVRDACREWVKREVSPIIEDAAQVLGVEIDGKKAGSFGDFGVFSFHSHKNITTLGEGGMLVVREKNLASIVPQLRHNGHCAQSRGSAD